MENLVQWALGTSLHEWVISEPWIWPALETIHFFGLCLLLGAMLIIDTRLIGWFKSVSFDAVHKLLPWVFVGFGMNLVTGSLFLLGDPERYAINIGFQIKMGLIVLCGLNALLFAWKLDGRLAQFEAEGSTSSLAKVVGGGSLLLWFGVLIMGRLIPYVGTG